MHVWKGYNTCLEVYKCVEMLELLLDGLGEGPKVH